MNAIQTLLTDHLDIWTSADTEKKSGRGRSSGNADRVYGIRKLRELILELAVRGKLVPQNANDEPASALLKRIQAEKTKLIAEGKIKNKSPSLPLLQRGKTSSAASAPPFAKGGLGGISEDEMPFDLPKGWEWARVSQVGHDWGQKTPDSDFTYIEVSAIDSQRGTVSSPELVKPENAPSRARKVVKKGSVIYSTIRPYLLNVAVIEDDFSPEPIASTAFAIVHPFCLMPPRYFLCFFRSPVFVRYVESVQMGIAYPAINDGQFFSSLIPLPPIEEQHRIVAKVDELMALCDRLEQQQTHSLAVHQTLIENLLGTLTRVASQQEFSTAWARIASHFDTLFTSEASIDQLKQTLLQLAVMGKLVPQYPNDESASELLQRIQAEKVKLIAEGKIKKDKPLAAITEDEKPFELPNGWLWTTLASISLVNPRNNAEDNSLASFVPMTMIGTKFNSSHDQEARLWKEIKQGFTHFAEGDIGVAKITPCFENSKACVFSGLLSGVGAGTTELHIVRPLNATLAPRFVLAYLKSPQFLLVGETKMTGTAGQKRLPKEFVESNPFPLPPLPEQHRIVAKVDELMALCDALKARLADAQAIQLHLADAIVEQAVC